jgi:hypothetical protein
MVNATDERVTPARPELAAERRMEMNPPIAGAVHCLQAPARSDSCAQKLLAPKRLEVISVNASVGEARFGRCCLDEMKQGSAMCWVGHAVSIVMTSCTRCRARNNPRCYTNLCKHGYTRTNSYERYSAVAHGCCCLSSQLLSGSSANCSAQRSCSDCSQPGWLGASTKKLPRASSSSTSNYCGHGLTCLVVSFFTAGVIMFHS